MIHCIGDSPVYVFTGVDTIGGNDILLDFKTYRLGPHTAYNAITKWDIIESFLKNSVKPSDSVMFCFGEIDCRVHLQKQSELQKRPLEDVVSECVQRYFAVFEKAKHYGHQLLAWNVPASSLNNVGYGEYSTYGNCKQRNEVISLFNKHLKRLCEKNGVIFISIFDKLVDDDGLTNPLYYMDSIHLSQRAMPLIQEVLRNHGIRLSPLQRDEGRQLDYLTTLAKSGTALEFRNIKSSAGSLRPQILQFLSRTFGLETFIETGTFMGDTTFIASDIFKTVHTIELSPELHQKAVKRFENRSHVHVHHGDSSSIFPEILGQNNQNVLFWLDGHYSEGITAKGDENTPIIQELKAIKNAQTKNAVILIDDLRMFDTTWDHIPLDSAARGYPMATSLCAAIQEIDPSYEFAVLGDVFMAYPKRDQQVISQVVAACTISRLYDGSNYELQEVLKAEAVIGAAQNEELSFLQCLYVHLIGSEEYGFGQHYRLWAALTQAANKKYDRACKELLIAINLGCEHWRVNWYLANDAYEAGFYSLADKSLEKAEQASPDFQEAIHLKQKIARDLSERRQENSFTRQDHLEIAVHLQRAGRTQAARDELQAILSGNASDKDVLYEYASCLIEAKQQEAASEQLQDILKRDPSYANAQNSLGVIAYQQGHLDKAMEYFGMALSQENLNHQALQNALILSKQLGISNEALCMLRDILVKFPNDSTLANIAQRFIDDQKNAKNRENTNYAANEQLSSMKKGNKSAAATGKPETGSSAAAASGITSGSDSPHSKTFIINMVYEHLSQQQMHTKHADSISIIWSAVPLEGCDVYAYVNASSFRGRIGGIQVLLMLEPVVVLPGEYSEVVWRNFDYVFTMCDALVGTHPRFVKIQYPRADWIVPAASTENLDGRRNNYPTESRANAICMINGNKHSFIESELYSKRMEAALWFHLHSDIPFEVYGRPPFALPNYRGALSPENKLPTLSHFRYSLCFENTNHREYSAGYITEKILDCLETRTIPIYLGAVNIEHYVPKECFIDMREFKSYSQLDANLRSMTSGEYLRFIDKIDDWVSRGGLRPYSIHRVYDKLASLLAGTALALEWQNGLVFNHATKQWHPVISPALWTWNDLANADPPVSVLPPRRAGQDSNDLTRQEKAHQLIDEFAEFKADAEENMKSNAASFYKTLLSVWPIHNIPQQQNVFVHPVWQKQLTALGELITQGLPENFLLHPICREMFVRIGWNKQQEHELSYIDQLSSKLRKKIYSLKESPIGSIPLDCKKLPLSVNTLGMIWYFARIHELLAKSPATVIELGGGFGSLARVFKSLGNPALTYTIIDLPEMLALQYFYLSATLGRDAVEAHVKPDERVVPGKINLFPVYGIEALNLSADLFVSTFALSETPRFMQEHVCGIKNFFNAPFVYITGQNVTERSELGWQPPQTIVQQARDSRQKVVVNRFHIGDNYELIASQLVHAGLNHPGTAARSLGARDGGNVVREDTQTTATPAQPNAKTVGLTVSKDRAMQLEATVRSFFKHCKDADQLRLKVLYTTSSNFHEAQYQQLKHEYPAVDFVRETSFKKDFLAVLSDFQYVLFMVDDNIFVRDFSLVHVTQSLGNNPDAIGFSLRLGKNTNYCYMLNRAQAVPPFQLLDYNMLKFNWTTGECDFGYPLELSSSLYRTASILPLLHQLDFKNPNTLEAALDLNKHRFAAGNQHLLCYATSVAFCNPINKVQTVYNNKSGVDTSYSPSLLAKLYSQGSRIDLVPFENFEPNSCHQEMNFRFATPSEEHAAAATGDRSAQSLVSIIILNYNGLEHIRPCLESIQRNTPERHEIIVVDNASTDGSKEELRSRRDITLVENQTNIGCPPARAQALTLATGDYVVFLDNDTIVTPRWLTTFLEHAKANPLIGIMGPRSNYVSGSQLVPNVPYKDIPGLEAFSLQLAAEHRDQLTRTRRLVGFCMFVRREVIDKIGNIDESFGKFGFEDDDYTWRAHIAGFTAVIANDVFIHHTGGPQGRGNQQYNQLLLQAWTVFRNKWELPANLAYGSPFDLSTILTRPFDPRKHYLPLVARSDIKAIVREASDRSRAAEKPSVASVAAKAIKKARELQEKDRLEDSIAALMDGIAQAPADKALYLSLAEILIEAKRYQDALDALNSLPEEGKNDIVALALRGYCHDGLGLFAEAHADADRVLARQPNSAMALNLKGVLAYKQGDRDGAERFFAAAVAAGPGYGEAYANLGVLKWSADRKEDGLPLLEKGFILSPTASELVSLYHTAIVSEGLFARAEKFFQEAKALHPNNKRIAFLLIDLLNKQEKHDLAMREIEQAMIRFGIDDGILAAALDVRGKVGPHHMIPSGKTEKTLSLCMIVKNEEHCLANCLANAKPIVHEMIVVDTGSNDRTKHIAHAFGAKVLDFEWTEDFSKARNFSLSKASGRWVLVLDADEVISPSDFAAVREIVDTADPSRTAYKIMTRNYSNEATEQGWRQNRGEYPDEEAATGWFPSEKVRIFVNDERIRFEAPVHELVEGSLQKAAIAIKPCTISVHHYGRLDAKKRATKGETYYLLGKKKMDEQGGDLKALLELGIQAGELGKYDEAVQLFKKLVDADPKYSKALFYLGYTYMVLGRHHDALPYCKEAYALDPGDREAAVKYAQCEIAVGDIALAVSLLEDMVRRSPDSIVAESQLAVAYCVIGESGKGIAILDRLREKNVDTASFVRDQAGILRSAGRVEDARRLLAVAVQANHASAKTQKLFEEGKTEDREKETIARPMTTKGLTSIIIAVQEGQEHVKQCIEALERNTPEEHEIVMVTSGANSVEIERLKRYSKKRRNYRVLDAGGAAGYAAYLNKGIAETSGEFIVLLSPKTLATENWLSGLRECIDSPSPAGVGIVGPMTNDKAGIQKVPRIDYEPHEGLEGFARDFRERNRHRRVSAKYVAGFCMLLRRDLVEKVGLFDENLGNSNSEDEDYCLRAALAGFKTIIAGDVFIHRGDEEDTRRYRRPLLQKWTAIGRASELKKKLTARDAIERANKLFEKGQDNDAVTEIMKGISHSPEEATLFYFLAGMLIEAKRYPDALDALKGLPEAAQRNRKGLELTGYAQEGMGRDVEAEATADLLLALYAESAAAMNLKGVLSYKRGDKDGAAVFFQRARALDPGYGEPLINLGILHWAADQRSEAVQLLEKGFILSPLAQDNVSAYYNAVSALQDWDRAALVFKEAASLHPWNRRLAFFLIELLLQQGDLKEAAREIEDGIIAFGNGDGLLDSALEIRAKVGPKQIDRAIRKKGTLSVCMIVKNEEQHMARCLRSLGPVADEMIVVDTGSTDRTKDIARAFGAKVYDFAWTNDFSAARNFSLEKASGDWVLVYDADEVLSPLDYSNLFDILRAGTKHKAAYSLVTRNYTMNTPQGWTANKGQYPKEEAGSGWMPTAKVRLFVNDPRVRFEGPVHEVVEHSLLRAGIPVKACAVPVHHYGRLNVEKTAAKAEEYYVLGKKKLEEKGGSHRALRELAIQAGELGKYEEAIELWKRLIAQGARGEDLTLAQFNMGSYYFVLENYEDALAMSKKVLELDPTMKENIIVYACSELCVGDVKMAIPALKKIPDEGADYPQAIAALMIAHLLNGDRDDGIACIRKLHGIQVNVPEYLYTFATYLIKADRIEYAVILLEAAIETGNLHQDTHALLAKCRRRLGAGDASARMVMRQHS